MTVYTYSILFFRVVTVHKSSKTPRVGLRGVSLSNVLCDDGRFQLFVDSLFNVHGFLSVVDAPRGKRARRFFHFV